MSRTSGYMINEIYSEVMFDLAEEAGLIEAVYEDIKAAGKVFQSEPDFLTLLTLGRMSDAEKEQILRRVFEGRISPLALDFLIVLARRGRLTHLFGIQENYEALMDRRRHIQKVEVTLAKPPTEQQLEQLQTRISDALGAAVKLDVKIDPDILGGIIIKKGDRQIDHSVRSLLDRSVGALMQSVQRRQDQKAARAAGE